MVGPETTTRAPFGRLGFLLNPRLPPADMRRRSPTAEERLADGEAEGTTAAMTNLAMTKDGAPDEREPKQLELVPVSQPTTTVLSAWPRMVVEELVHRGIDGHGVADRVGLELQAVYDAGGRVPARKVVDLWNRAVAVSADQSIGLAVGARSRPTSFQAWSMAFCCSPTLDAAIGLLIDFPGALGALFRASVEPVRLGARLELHEVPGHFPLPAAASDAVVTALLDHAAYVSARDIRPLTITASPRFGSWRARCEEAWRIPIELGSTPSITFQTRDLMRPLPYADKALSRSMRSLLEATQSRADTPLVEQVYETLAELIVTRHTCSAEAVARSLNMSLRTLQRHLGEEHSSVSAVRDQVRKDLALQRIEVHSASAGNLAHLLGFKEPVCFARAFKRWTGCSLTTYRQQHHI